jgi:hypothetical protein
MSDMGRPKLIKDPARSLSLTTVKMPPLPSIPQIRLENVTTGLTTAVKTLEVLSGNLNTPFLEVIVNTTESLLASAEVSSSSDFP